MTKRRSVSGLALRLLLRGLPLELREEILADLEELRRLGPPGWRGRWRCAREVLSWAWRAVRDRRLLAPRAPRERAFTRCRRGADALAFDLRLAVRRLGRSRGSALAVVASLGLGVGGVTALFGLLDRTLLHPLPVESPERLVRIYSAKPDRPFLASNFADYLDLRAATGAELEGLAAFAAWEVSLLTTETARVEEAELVTRNYFRVLGIEPALGRWFLEKEPEAREVVISHRLFQSAFGGDAALLGSTVRLTGHVFTVVGVAPPGFRGVTLERLPELWIPAARYDDLAVGFYEWFRATDYEEQRTTRARISMWEMVGRLRPGVERARLETALEVAGERLAEEFPQNASIEFLATPAVTAALPLAQRERTVHYLWLLGGALVLVLLVSCANAGNLLLARDVEREPEVGVLAALGAERVRVVRTILLEATLLALAGATLAVGVAVALSRAIASFELPGGLPLAPLALAPDRRLVVFAFGTAVAGALAGSWLPAWRAGRRVVSSTAQGSAMSGLRTRFALVVAQVAISTVLLVLAGLSIRSLRAGLERDLGFETRDLVTIQVDPSLQRYEPGQAERTFTQWVRDVARLAGVEGVALTSTPFGESALGIGGVFVEGGGRVAGPEVELAWVSADYPRVLGLELVAGRGFESADRGAPRALVSAALAERLWPESHPVGRGFKFNDDPQQPYFEVVGVVEDTRHFALEGEPAQIAYFDLAEDWSNAAQRPMTLVVRSRLSPNVLVPAVRRSLREIDPALPIHQVATMRDRVAGLLGPQRLGFRLLGWLGTLSLVLAGIGLYGVLATGVAARRRELGVRQALGATPRRLELLAVREGLIAVVLGSSLGLAGSLAAARAASAFLPGVAPADPVAIAGALGALLGVASVACWRPAVRASRVDPVESLRAE